MSASAMDQYLQLMRTILSEGIERDDRTGTGTRVTGVFCLHRHCRKRCGRWRFSRWPGVSAATCCGNYCQHQGYGNE